MCFAWNFSRQEDVKRSTFEMKVTCVFGGDALETCENIQHKKQGQPGRDSRTGLLILRMIFLSLVLSMSRQTFYENTEIAND